MGVRFKTGGGGGGGGGLTNLAGHIAADVSLTQGLTTAIMSTAALAVGKWLVSFSATIDNSVATVAVLETQVVVGTATATFDGAAACAGDCPATNTQPLQMELSFTATVTVAGTLTFQCNNSGTAACNAKAATAVNAFPNATGYTALKIG